MQFHTVIFDLDDTLYPEWEYVRSGFTAVEHWLLNLGVACYGISESWYQVRRTGEPKVFDLWLQSGQPAADRTCKLFGSLDDAGSSLVNFFRTHSPRIRAYQGVNELLVGLRDVPGRRCNVGLVTDGNLLTQRAKLESLGLGHHFDAIVYSDELGRDKWKPNPTPFFEVLRRLNEPAGHAVYVGDNPNKDFLGARLAGIQSVRLRMPDGVYGLLEPRNSAHRPDHEFRSVDSLAHWLGVY